MPVNDLSNQRQGSTNTLASERFVSSESPLNQPIVCEFCGSTFFFTVHAEQFASGGYGSVEMRSLSTSPQVLRICPCGRVFTASRTGAGGSRKILSQRDQFYDSIEKALDYRNRTNPDQIAKVTASKSELDVLTQKVEQLEAMLNELRLVTQEPSVRIEPILHEGVTIEEVLGSPAKASKPHKKK